MIDKTLAIKTYKTINRFFIVNVVLSIVLLHLAFFIRNDIAKDYTVYQLYIIVLTIIGISLSLILFQWQYTKIKFSKNIKKYKSAFYTRLFIIDVLYIINVLSLYITGSKNFSFLAIILIFVLFLCAPNQKQIRNVLHSIQ